MDSPDNGDEHRVMVDWPDGGGELATMTHLGGDRYRVDSIPLMSDDVGIKDEVEAVEQPDKSLRIVRVLRRSGWETVCFGIVDKESLLEDDTVHTLITRAQASGCHWEWVFGFLYIACPPNDSDLDTPHAD